ncbi:hypothetical protein N9L02_03305 [Gammaproteobacteria bacterium]|nr:hypothetical protein [Gammaproteobacteria bacterium]
MLTRLNKNYFSVHYHFVIWWTKTTETWSYKELLKRFINKCWV